MYSRIFSISYPKNVFIKSPFLQLIPWIECRCHRPSIRQISSSPRPYRRHLDHEEPFRKRLRNALRETKIKWYPIPVGLGIGLLCFIQFYKTNEREKARGGGSRDDEKAEGWPQKRKRIRPDGPWQVQVLSTLPLKAMSRLWGRFNELEIPYYLRVPGFKLYGYIFGVDFSEASEPDLHAYPNLASFFYRTLKPGVRPLDPNQNALLSPADGRVLQFGTIEGGEVEQVKGMTYSLDALLGASTPYTSLRPLRKSRDEKGSFGNTENKRDEGVVKQDEKFATINGISYTLPDLFGPSEKQFGQKPMNASTAFKAASEAEVRANIAPGDEPWYTRLTQANNTALYYVVIYLAPGDYHHFHSPTAWVVKRRRHFAGELYSVSPYLQRNLPGLFTLNERVVLLGRWRCGFFSMIPVGATNVGSIKINFDRELRTNSLLTDTAADRAAAEAQNSGEPYSGFVEATFEGSSPVLRGHPLRRGEDMGGFQLGSTIVLIFEAPEKRRPDSLPGDRLKRKEGWNWALEKGQKIKVGQTLGWVDEI